MADSSGDNEPLQDGTHEPRECMACRGTGRVISNLGGSQSTVACPWCGGNGLRPAEIDAQAHWPREQAGAGGESSEASAQTPDAPDAAA